MAIGAYAVERDYSHYVSYLTKTVFAVVGTATKGPVGEATVCTSAQDLVNKFGPLHEDCPALYAGQYFLSQASKLYFVRAAHEATLAAASVKVKGLTSSSTTVNDAITLEILEKGTYGNAYSIKFSLPEGSEEYTITLLKDNASVEVIKGVEFSDLIVGYQTKYFKITAKTNSAFTGVDTEDTYEFSGGSDGITSIEAADYNTAAEALEATQIDMNLFAVPGVSDSAVITAMLSLAETRGDCLYLVDPPQNLTRDEVVAWHNGAGSGNNTAFNSSYGALYYDWVYIYDSVNKKKVLVPPSVVVSATIAYSDRISEPWYAPAGLTRGIVRGVTESKTKLSRNDTEYIYSGEGNSVNPLYDDPQVGLVLWGQKTLLKTDTALNRINVRRMMNYLKRVITTACDYLTFEPNDRVTWNSFEQLVMPVLDSLKNRRGIYEYSLVRGDTIVTSTDIDNYRMPCMVMIRPTKAAEEIPIHFVITSTGADFNEVLEANGVSTVG